MISLPVRIFPRQSPGNAHGHINLLSFLALPIREISLLFVPTQGGGMEINMGIAGIIGSPRAKRTIGIAGLGLIGGSMAKRLSRDSKNTVLGYDRDDKVIAKALEEKAIKARLTEDFSACDIIIIALYPKETVEFFKQHADNFKKGCLITDVCGIKKYVCDEINPVAQQKDLYFRK